MLTITAHVAPEYTCRGCENVDALKRNQLHLKLLNGLFKLNGHIFTTDVLKETDVDRIFVLINTSLSKLC